MFEGKKVLVTGGTGFIGTNLIIRLSQLGYQIRALWHKKLPRITPDNVAYMCADLTKMDNCKRVVEGMDYVFMCAANTSGAAVIEKTPLAHVTPNIVMNAQMLEAAHLAGAERFLFISSSAAYPDVGDRPVYETELLEGQLYPKYYPVGWMKRYSEILCRTWAQYTDMNVVVVRPANIYGKWDDFNPATSHMVAALIRKVVERQDPIEVWGTGNDIRDLIYVDDFITGMLLAFEKIGEWGAVNIATGRDHTVRDVLSTLLKIDRYEDANVVYDTSKPSTIPARRMSINRAKAWLGFDANTTLEEGLRKTVEWYKNEYQC